MQDRLTGEQRLEDLREEDRERVERRKHGERQKSLERKPEKYEEVKESEPRKYAPTLNIPVKSPKKLNVEYPKVLQIGIPRTSSLRLALHPTPKRQPATMVLPRLKVLQASQENIRISTLEPTNVRTLASPPLRLKLKPIPDVSVRPVIYQKLSKLTETVSPLIRHTRAPTYTPLTVATSIERSNTVCVPRIRIPSISVEEYTTPHETTQPDSKVSTLTDQVEDQVPVEERQIEAQEAISLSHEVALEEESLQDPLEVLFEVRGAGGAKSKIREVEPLVILFRDQPNDSYIQTFETLLLRLYREKYGGYPEVKKLSLREDWNKREIEQWLDEGKLFLIDLDSERASGRVSVEEKLLADRLWAVFSKKRGIVIFYTKNDRTFEEYASMLNNINLRYLNLRASIVEVTPRKLSYEEKLRLVGLLFGFVTVRGEISFDSMDILLNLGEKEYDKKLGEIEYQYCDVLGLVKLGENESEEHLRGKAFILHCLVRELEKKGRVSRRDPRTVKDRIKTEEPINGGIIVDVRCDGENYEFETLFEEGFKGVHEKLRNYEERRVSNVKIVVEPITAFLHAREFAEVLKMVDKMYPTVKVDFLTFDVLNERLIPLRDYLKEVKCLIAKYSKFYHG